MEPLNVEPLDLDEPDNDQIPSDIDDMPDVDETTHRKVAELHTEIIAFKDDLYKDLVIKKENTNPLGIGAMTTFHSLYLQSLAYFISLLDSSLVAKPTFQSKDRTYQYDTLVKFIESIKHKTPDIDVLLYNLFFKLSTQHPFSFKQDSL